MIRFNFMSLWISLFLFTSCSNTIDIRGLPKLNFHSPDSDDLKHSGKVSLKYIQTGFSETRDGLAYTAGSIWNKRKLSFLSVLIQHPKGNLLIDSGIGRRILKQTDLWPWWSRFLLSYQTQKFAKDVLDQNKISVDHILLTHMHWDHAGGIEDFNGANAPKVWTDKNERNFAKSKQAEMPEFIQDQYNSPEIKWHDIVFENRPYEVFEESYDFYEDGRIIIVPLYGHTPGSIGIFVNVSSKQRYFFIGDLAWVQEGVKLPAHKSAIASAFADREKKMVERQLIKVHQLLKRNKDIVVLPAHDLQLYKKHFEEL